MKLPSFKRAEEQPARRLKMEEDPASIAKQSLAFRRNRTLMGSMSPKVSSTGELNAELLSPRGHVHHLSKLRRHLFLRLIVVLVVALLIYIFIHQFVAKVNVSGEGILPDRRGLYEARIDKFFSERPTERFYPWVNQKDLTNFVQSEYSEIDNINLELGGVAGQATAQVQLRQPVARWIINGKTEYVDHTGVVFNYSDAEAPGLQIVDNSGAPPLAGDLVTSNRFLGFVGRIVGAAKAQGLTVTQAIIPPLTTRQLELHVSEVPYAFKLTVDRSAGEQTEDMARLVNFLRGRGITPSYVDVRVAGKAFYK